METLEGVAAVRDFIAAHWRETLRFHPTGEGTRIGLPRPYTVPCRTEAFQELYYWDTYFTCVGLRHLGEKEAVLDNLRNFLFELRQFGFIPNGSRTYYLNRSQPPYLAALVRLVIDDAIPLPLRDEIVEGLKIEHRFWTERRATACGLSRYGHHATETELAEFYGQAAGRAQLADGSEAIRLAESAHTLAEAESGWDFTPRFDHRCLDFCPVDLNSLLHDLKTTLADLVPVPERPGWLTLAAQRKELIQRLCWDGERASFFDYDTVNGRPGAVTAASAFQPLWSGIATPEQAAALVTRTLPLLEFDHGVAACAAPGGARACQWDYPNLWPCMQTVVCRALLRYGYHAEARRIASKYVATVVRAFGETGDLWEKYDARTGAVQRGVHADYGTPSMMGWTMGAFLDCVRLLEETA